MGIKNAMEKRMDNIDLTPKQHSEVKALLKRHLPNVEVWAYGSRVTFKTRHNSDLDLVAFADKGRRSALHDLREAFEESFLPFSVDVLAWGDIPERFKPNIRRAYYVLQEREASDKKFKTVKLGEVSEIIGGGTPSTNDAENYGGDIPWITPRDLSSYSQRYIKRGARNITEKGLASSSARMLPKNTVLFTTRAPIGYIALAANEVSTNQGFKGLVLKDGHVPEFYYYLLKHYTPEIVACDTGSTFGEITSGLLNSFKVKIPDTQTQKAIARILGMLDDKIEGNEKINRELEKTAKMIFQLWFVDFAPVRAKMAGRPTGLSPEISTLFPNELVKRKNSVLPKGWSEGNILSLCKKVADKFRNKADWASEKLIDLGRMPIKSITLDKHGRGDELSTSVCKFKKHDFLFGSIRPYFYKAGIAPFDGVTNTSVFVMRPLSREKREFLYCYASLNETFEKSIICSKGTKMPIISWEDFSNFKFPMPTDDIMLAFSELTGSFFKKIMLNNEENVILSELRDVLLPMLISGELQIKDAEKIIKRAKV